MTSSPHGLYVQGYTRATMVRTMGRSLARGANLKNLALVRMVGCNSPA